MEPITVFLIFQTILDVFLLCAVGLGYLAWRRMQEDPSSERLSAALNVLEARAARQEADWLRLREQLEDRIRALNALGEEAKAILSKGQGALMGPGSWEEKELEAVVARPAPRPEPESAIPTLSEVERTRTRLRTEVALDLKTVLREHLV